MSTVLDISLPNPLVLGEGCPRQNRSGECGLWRNRGPEEIHRESRAGSVLFWGSRLRPLFIYLLFIFPVFFCLCCMACEILVPQPEIEPMPPALEAQSLNHWTTRGVPALGPFRQKFCLECVFPRQGLVWRADFTFSLCVRLTCVPGTQVSSASLLSSTQPSGGLTQTLSVLSSYKRIGVALLRISLRGFPGGSVVKNLPINAGDTGPILGPGRSHMPRSS